MKTYILLCLIGFVTITLIAGTVMLMQKEQVTEPVVTAEETATTTPLPTPIPVSNTPTFNQPTKFTIGQNIIFSDGLSVTLQSIEDSRCKPGVQCIWAGELTPVVVITGGEFGTVSKSIRLGTALNESESSRGYIFALVTADEKTTTLQISKAITQSTGEVTGQVTVGPVCPVERVDDPCVVPAETYTSRNVVVFSADGNREITRLALDPTGKYSLPLVPGTYLLQIQPAGIGAGELKSVTILANQFSTIDFDIDTGIR